MKKVLFLVIFVFSVQGNHLQASCCIEHDSELDGIALIDSYYNGDNKLNFIFQGGEAYNKYTQRNSDFIKNCTERNKLFINELGGNEFTCKIIEKNDDSYQIEAGAPKSKKIAINSALNKKSSDVYTISLSPLAYIPVKPMNLSKEEIRDSSVFLKKTIKPPKSDDSRKYTNVIGKNENLTLFEGIRPEAPIKIRINGTDILFIPSFLLSTELDEDILTSVVLSKNGQYKLLGQIYGCIKRFGADLDADGYPEIITGLCSPNEYMQYRYIKYYPMVRNYISLNPG